MRPASVLLCTMVALAITMPLAAADMSFLITSKGPGEGANLGGVSGTDAHCQKLAAAAGAGGKTWRAYLSSGATDGEGAVNARDRIALSVLGDPATGGRPWTASMSRFGVDCHSGM